MVGEEKGRRKGGKKRVVEEEVPTYVTTELAVRCLRSRRCLLIYWRDNFRRRAAFRKWRRSVAEAAPRSSTSDGKLPRYLQPRTCNGDER